MSKAILVIDMPESCDDCHFCYYSDGRVPSCQLKLRAIDNYMEKPDWCPLKPMPEKYEINRCNCSDPHYEFEYEYGYNACIDAIIGGNT